MTDKWVPSLHTERLIDGLIGELVRKLPYLIGVDEIIPNCQVINMDPYTAGVVPRYITVALRNEYYTDAIYRGLPAGLVATDYVTVAHIRDGDIYEVLMGGGASGTSLGVHTHVTNLEGGQLAGAIIDGTIWPTPGSTPTYTDPTAPGTGFTTGGGGAWWLAVYANFWHGRSWRPTLASGEDFYIDFPTALGANSLLIREWNGAAYDTLVEIDDDGNITQWATDKEVVGDGASTYSTLRSYLTGSAYGSFRMYRYRGTLASPLAVLDTYVLGRLVWGGYNGAAVVDSAYIQATAIENWANGPTQAGTELQIYTTRENGASPSLRGTWEERGSVLPADHDYYPRGDEAGLLQRGANAWNGPNDHFPTFATWAWAAVTHSGTPNEVNTATYDSLLLLTDDDLVSDFFFYQSIQVVEFWGRLSKGLSSYMGMRMDDASNNNYVEWRLVDNATPGLFDLQSITVTGAAAPVTTTYTLGLPAAWYIFYIIEDGGDFYFHYREDIPVDLLIGSLMGQVWTVSRFGFVFGQRGVITDHRYSGLVDWAQWIE